MADKKMKCHFCKKEIIGDNYIQFVDFEKEFIYIFCSLACKKKVIKNYDELKWETLWVGKNYGK